MLLEDCAAVRKQAAELDLVLQGWSHMVRDLIFYALLYGRKSMWESRLSHILRGTVGEIDGVKFVNDSKATNAEAAEQALKAYKNAYWRRSRASPKQPKKSWSVILS